MALYVVTGGAGFIGSHLTRALVGRGHRARIIDDLSSGDLANLVGLGLDEPRSGAPVEFHRGDIGDQGLLREALRGAAGVFHEAAQVSVPASLEDPVESYRVNVMGTLAVLEAARAERVPKVVFAASSAAYGDDPALPKVESMTPRPLSPYASGKLAGEALLSVWGRAFALETVSLRYFNVYGPGQSDSSPYSGVIALFCRAVIGGWTPTIYGDGSQTRDFIFVEDVVRANLAAMERTLEAGRVINVGAGRSITIRELYERIARLAGSEGPARLGPARVGDVPHSRASIDRARDELGFEPSTPLDEGLARTIAWYRARSQAG